MRGIHKSEKDERFGIPQSRNPESEDDAVQENEVSPRQNHDEGNFLYPLYPLQFMRNNGLMYLIPNSEISSFIYAHTSCHCLMNTDPMSCRTTVAPSHSTWTERVVPNQL